MQQIAMFETEQGWIGIAGADQTVHHVWIGSPSEQELFDRINRQFEHPIDKQIGDWFPQLRERLTDYADGVLVDFQEFEINSSSNTSFQQRVFDVTRGIPYGTTLSYQQVAALAGSPKAYRAVGNIMAKNRVPILIPCHRVVGAQGELRGFSAPSGIQLKQELLSLEQVGCKDTQLTLALSS